MGRIQCDGPTSAGPWTLRARTTLSGNSNHGYLSRNVWNLKKSLNPFSKKSELPSTADFSVQVNLLDEYEDGVVASGSSDSGKDTPVTPPVRGGKIDPMVLKIADELSKFGQPPIIHAVRCQDEDAVLQLLDSGSDCNLPDTQNKTALHYALEQEDIGIFKILINHGAKVDLRYDSKQRSVIHQSIIHKHPTFINAILEKPDMPVNAASQNQTTPLMLACEAGKDDIVEKLIKNKADVLAVDENGRCAMHYASTPGSVALLADSHPALINMQDTDGISPFQSATIAGNVATMRTLLTKGANINAMDNEQHTAAHWAVVSYQKEALEVLIANKGKLSLPDANHAYPLHYASQKADTEKELNAGLENMALLIGKGVPVDCTDGDNRQPLIWAASSGNSAACELLLKNKANVDACDRNGLTALHCACSGGHEDCAVILLNYNANQNSSDKYGCTPLHYTSTMNHSNITKCLLDNGADPNIQDRKGRTTVHCAAAKGSMDTMKVLQQSDANLWVKNNRGEYPFHESTQNGGKSVDMMELLVESAPESVNINEAVSDGSTGLHMAVARNDYEVTRVLLKKGAKVNAVVKYQERYVTPLDIAEEKGHTEIGALLQDQGGLNGTDVSNSAAFLIQKRMRKLSQVRKKQRFEAPKTMDIYPGVDETPKEEDADKEAKQSEKNDESQDNKSKKKESNEKVIIESEKQEENNSSNLIEDNVTVKIVPIENKQKTSDSETNDEKSDKEKDSGDENEGKNDRKPESDDEKHNTDDDDDELDKIHGAIRNLGEIDNSSNPPLVPVEEEEREEHKDEETKEEEEEDKKDEEIKEDSKGEDKKSESDLDDRRSESDTKSYDDDFDKDRSDTESVKSSRSSTIASTESSSKSGSTVGKPTKTQLLREALVHKKDRREERMAPILKPQYETVSPRSPRKKQSAMEQEIRKSVYHFLQTRKVVEDLRKLRQAHMRHNSRGQEAIIQRLADKYREEGRLDAVILDINSTAWEHYLYDELKHLTKSQTNRSVVKEIAASVSKEERQRYIESANSERSRTSDEVSKKQRLSKVNEDKETSEREKSDKEFRERLKKTEKSFDETNQMADVTLRDAKSKNSDLESGRRSKIARPVKGRGTPSRSAHYSNNAHQITMAYQADHLAKEQQRPITRSQTSASYYQERRPGSALPSIHRSKPTSAKPAQPTSSASMRRSLMSTPQTPMQRAAIENVLAKLQAREMQNISKGTPRYDGSTRPRYQLIYVEKDVYKSHTGMKNNLRRSFPLQERHSSHMDV